MSRQVSRGSAGVAESFLNSRHYFTCCGIFLNKRHKVSDITDISTGENILLDIHIPRENHNSKRHVYPSAHSSTIYSSQDMETMGMPINRGTDKAGVVCVCNGILLSHKKGMKLGHLERHGWTWRPSYRVRLSQKEKNRYRILRHICET